MDVTRADLPDDVMASLLEVPGTDETILTRWSHCVLTGSPGATLGRGQANDLPTPEVNARTVLQRGETEPADYLIADRLGEGGMGVVFEAEQVYFGRRIALKMIKPTLAADPMAVKTFFREAIITSRLDHPGVIPVLDFGVSQDDRALYAMAKAGGVPWHRVLRDKTLSENLAIFDRVADVVAYAHRQGVLHRDIKPANVFLGNHGEVWLGDWGVALARRSDGSYSYAGPAGTPSYMAPEMARCEADSIGPASDIYLLGAVLFELITGSPPHDGDNVRTALLASASNTIHTIGHPNGILQIAYKAMATKPEHRFASVDDLRDAVKKRLELNESIYRQQQADTHLSAARKTGEYELFQMAVAGYDEAIALSPDNNAARQNRIQALIEYADKALKKGEFDLAASVLQADAQEVRAARLLQKITKGKTAAARKHRRRTWTNTILGSIVFLTLMGGAYVYFDRMNPDSRFRQPGLDYKKVRIMNIVRGDMAQARMRIADSQLHMDNMLNWVKVSKSNAAKRRDVVDRMRYMTDAWLDLFDIPDAFGPENAFRTAATIDEEIPQLSRLVDEYRSVTEGPTASDLAEQLKKHTAKTREYLEHALHQRDEWEKMAEQ